MKTKILTMIMGLLVLQTGFAQIPDPGETQGDPSAEQTNAPAPKNISTAASEIIRLAESGVGDDALLAYVKGSQTKFELSAQAILYLKDLGLSSEVLTAMLERDRESTDDHLPVTQQEVGTVSASSGADHVVATSETTTPTYASDPPAEVNHFYNQLSPYGTWVTLAGVGWCWQPHCCVLSRDWRPYCHGGHWVYTDCGWYWKSDYSWGWAPFHYGRWHHHERCGWVWCPGREWAPAWVTWRVSHGHCGWAPLPPNAIYVIGAGWRHK